MPTTLDVHLPFDAGAGASVTEGQWRALAEKWMQDGVVAGVTNELAVAQRAAGANMSVDVATGEARVRGHQGISTSVKNLTIEANGSGNPRVDLVVLRADFANNRVELDVLAGTAAAAPVEPTLTQSSSVWEIPLAAVAVSAGAASIVTADLRDRRTFTRTVAQMFVKEPARFATTAALAASTVVGTKRTANANGAFPATDGVTAVAGDRLLDKDHGTAAQRGVWRLTELGSASRPWVMERPADFDESRDVTDGSWVVVKEGTLYAGTGWLQTANDPITLGTTSLAFTQFPIVDPFVLKTANESVVNNTLQNDDQLVLAVAANKIYTFEAFLIFTSSGIGVDLQVAFTIPAGATISWGGAGPQVGAADVTDDGNWGFTNSSGGALQYGTGLGAQAFVHICGVVVVAGTAGNLQLQFAQVNTDGAQPVTVYADSWLAAKSRT